MSTSQIIIFTKCRIGYNPTKYSSTECVSEKLDRFSGLSHAISLLSWFCFIFVDVGILVICITDLFLGRLLRQTAGTVLRDVKQKNCITP